MLKSTESIPEQADVERDSEIMIAKGREKGDPTSPAGHHPPF
jgi:hypothetical protein